ncbi:MAG: polymer-forming cytoskeletal protein [Betaproteobacteria bacterium]
MLNFKGREAAPDPKDANKGTLRPAIYDPPATVEARLRADANAKSPAISESAVPVLTDRAATPPPSVHQSTGMAGSKLYVGPGIKLEGVAVNDCDLLVIEGHVEATIHSKAMEIAAPGTLSGTAWIDVADIHGEFTGDLTARTRLTIHGTGRVSGVVRYGSLIVAEGALLAGDVQRLDANAAGSTVAVSADAQSRTTVAARPTLGPSAERSSH